MQNILALSEIKFVAKHITFGYSSWCLAEKQTNKQKNNNKTEAEFY